MITCIMMLITSGTTSGEQSPKSLDDVELHKPSVVLCVDICAAYITHHEGTIFNDSFSLAVHVQLGLDLRNLAEG